MCGPGCAACPEGMACRGPSEQSGLGICARYDAIAHRDARRCDPRTPSFECTGDGCLALVASHDAWWTEPAPSRTPRSAW